MLHHKYLWVVYVLVQILNLASCDQGHTLAFAIDDTKSMWDDIAQVKAQARAITDIALKSNTTNIKDMVLVTINDPDVIVRKRTNSSDVFIEHINRIKVSKYWNEDCPENSLEGIEKALKYSRPGSYIYVFTDASAKDYSPKYLKIIKNLCQKKQSQVIFVLTGDCNRPQLPNFLVYYEIAEACSGQVFPVDKGDVSSILDTIKILLQAAISVFKWINIPPSVHYTAVPFDLDEKAEYALVSTSGRNVELTITTTQDYYGHQPHQRVTTWAKNTKVIELIKPPPGTYYAWVKGDSTVSVVVYGRTDFTFDYGFSILKPKSIADATKQPIAGVKQHVTVNVTDHDNSVDIKSVQILDIHNNDAVINELPLMRRPDGLYITDPFVSPNTTFRIAVTGEVKRTKQPIVRYSRTNVNPVFVDLTPESKPKVSIAEGTKVDVKYGSSAVLTCNVKAHPKPEIAWYTASGIPMAAESSEKSKPDYISYLKLNQVKNDESYVCEAKNNLGRGKEKILVHVPSVFTENEIPKQKYNPKFGEKVTIPCKITSYLPITIKWYKSGKQLTGGSDYSISRDGTVLTLDSLTVGQQGEYTCEASLNSDPPVKKTHTIDVVIPGLAAPKIKKTNRNIKVKEGDKIELDCTTSQGYPKPEVKWTKIHPNQIVVPVTTEKLRINKSTFLHAGKYRCETTNPIDTDSAVFDVTVIIPPKIAVSEKSKTVPYDSSTELVCKGEAYPPPTTQWQDEKGAVPQQRINKFSEYQLSSTLAIKNLRRDAVYTCVVSNTDLSVKEKVSITVSPPFKIKHHIDGTKNINYGAKETLQCDIKSEKAMNIRWYIQRKGATSGRTLIASSDKLTLSDDGTKLTINSMDLTLVGQYTCEASLVSYPDEKVSFNTNVDIVGLTAPKIKPTNRNLKVKEGEKIVLDCSTNQGYPKPEVKWTKIHPTQVDVPVTSEVLTMEKATFQHAGRYRCDATNPLSTDSAFFDVTVIIPPKIAVTASRQTVPYDSSTVLVCKGEAYPPPTTQWQDDKGAVPQQRLDQFSEYQLSSIMPLNNLKRDAVYTCVVNNTDGSVKEKVSISVLSPFKTKNHISGVTGIYYGATETLTCDIKSGKAMTIRWYMQKKGAKSGRALIASSNKYTLSEDGTKLTFKSMDMDMVGQYTCEASLSSDPEEKVSFKTDVDVVGLIFPEVVSATTIVDKKNFTAICRIKGVPTPVISWQFKPNGSDAFHVIPGSGEEMNIPDIKLSDTGIYKCIAKNFLGGTERDFNVVVEEIPKIISTVTDLYGLEGDIAMKVPCTVTGYPEPTIVWKKGDKVITAGAKYIIKGDTLYINKPETSDSEEYTCEATNKQGSDTKTFNVEVTDTFIDDDHYTGDTQHINVELGKPKIIKCVEDDLKPDSIRWYQDGVLTEKRGNTYTIDDVSFDDEKNYTCRVNTNEGSTSHTYVLHVGYPPTFEDSTSPKIIVWKDSEQFLDCKAESEPMAKYEWYHNGKSIISGINLVQKRINDWGGFSCKASNTFGSVEKSFKVTAEGCLITNSISTPNQPLASDQDTPTWASNMTNSDIFLKEHEEIKFSCPSPSKSGNNFKVAPNKNELIAKCITQDKFSVDGKSYKYSELQCNSRVKPSVRKTGEECAGISSTTIRVGFEVNGFVEAYKVCYDKNLNVPIYASTSSPAFKYVTGAHAAQFDWISTPELEDPNTGLWKAEGSCKCCYTKSPLLGFNELPIGPAQAAIFKDTLNSVSVWNPTCGDDDNSRISWQTFSEQIKKVSVSYKLSSWTGASDYTYKDVGLVPRYLWKMIYNKYENEWLAMVYVNDRHPSSADVRCSAPCEPLTETDRFLYCCSKQEFLDNFHVPKDTFADKMK